MGKTKKLIGECKSRNMNCSITYENITDCSVEIYTGYGKNYERIFYTDGHLKPKKAVKKALKFIHKNK